MQISRDKKSGDTFNVSQDRHKGHYGWLWTTLENPEPQLASQLCLESCGRVDNDMKVRSFMRWPQLHGMHHPLASTSLMSDTGQDHLSPTAFYVLVYFESLCALISLLWHTYLLCGLGPEIWKPLADRKPLTVRQVILCCVLKGRTDHFPSPNLCSLEA